MEEIKGMSEAEARKWLMKRGYGLGEIDQIMADHSAPAPAAAPAPAPKADPAPKAAPKAAAPKAASKASSK